MKSYGLSIIKQLSIVMIILSQILLIGCEATQSSITEENLHYSAHANTETLFESVNVTNKYIISDIILDEQTIGTGYYLLQFETLPDSDHSHIVHVSIFAKNLHGDIQSGERTFKIHTTNNHNSPEKGVYRTYPEATQFSDVLFVPFPADDYIGEKVINDLATIEQIHTVEFNNQNILALEITQGNTAINFHPDFLFYLHIILSDSLHEKAIQIQEYNKSITEFKHEFGLNQLSNPQTQAYQKILVNNNQLNQTLMTAIQLIH
ncbi:hypothetical protein DID76_00595 [Candidatus Marinamargulisbacteria bacterium SCGC AG-414-C22]|nr:hypothetical protein DID76_00595 [Candidatus Marinamargulisbacteria bacterium SCGC AG-414-C22]